MNRFFPPIMIRVIIILCLGFLAVYILLNTYFWLVSIWLFAMLVFAVWELSRYLAKTRREYSEFLLAISQDDFSTRTNVKRPDELQNAYETVRRRFIEIRKEMTAGSQFLEALIEHAGVALIGYEKESGKITIMNQAAKVLFHGKRYHNIDLFARDFPEVASRIKQLESGNDALVKTYNEGRIHQLSLNSKEMVVSEVPYKLISIQDIQNALDNKELESWQKLIRVLTHEIKNSVIPISTLSDVIQDIILVNGNFRDLSELDHEEKTDVENGLSVIRRRSQSLVDFVSAYGELARLPEPAPSQVPVKTMVSNIVHLMEDSLSRRHVDLLFRCAEDLYIYADQTLIEQVLINLIKNAAEALEETQNPQIRIHCESFNDQCIIEIEDNGPGMSKDLLEQVFIPFYSTKRNGSGIGLSLSRQIMRAHQAKLEVESTVGKGTRFRLVF